MTTVFTSAECNELEKVLDMAWEIYLRKGRLEAHNLDTARAALTRAILEGFDQGAQSAPSRDRSGGQHGAIRGGDHAPPSRAARGVMRQVVTWRIQFCASEKALSVFPHIAVSKSTRKLRSFVATRRIQRNALLSAVCNVRYRSVSERSVTMCHGGGPVVPPPHGRSARCITTRFSLGFINRIPISCRGTRVSSLTSMATSSAKPDVRSP